MSFTKTTITIDGAAVDVYYRIRTIQPVFDSEGAVVGVSGRVWIGVETQLGNIAGRDYNFSNTDATIAQELGALIHTGITALAESRVNAGLPS